MQGVLSSILEVVGLCFFSLVIAVRLDNASLVLTLMNGVFIVYILLQLWKQFQNFCCRPTNRNLNADGYVAFPQLDNNEEGESKKTHALNIVLLLVSLICSLAGSAVAVYFEVGRTFIVLNN